MTLIEAQKNVKSILDRINDNLTNEQREPLILELEALLNEVPLEPQYLEVRSTIHDSISDLSDANIDELVGNIESRNSALSAAIGGLNEVTDHTNRVSKILTLEGANKILDITKEGFTKVEDLKKALDEGDPQKIGASMQTVSDFFTSVRAEAEAKIEELKKL
jgi:ABC-type transporter Mla subunit MlaD